MSDFLGPYTNLKQLLSLNLQAKSLTLPKANRVNRPQSGLHFSKFKGRGMEFAEVRAYQPGDDVRSIDWKVTARRNSPHTKLFHEERERPILILCDQSQSMFFGSQTCFKSVRAAEAASLFAWTALKHNDRVGGIVFSNTGHQEIKPARNRKNLMQFLNIINQFNNALSVETETEGRDDCFNSALAELSRTAKPGTLIVLVSDFLYLDNTSERHIINLAQHNELVLVQIYDPLETELPPPGVYQLARGNKTITINSSIKEDRDTFRNFHINKERQLIKLSTKARAPFIKLSTEDSLSSSLNSVLQSYSRS